MKYQEETHEEQVMRVLNEMVEAGEVEKIEVNGEEFYTLKPKAEVKFKLHKKMQNISGEGFTKVIRGQEKLKALKQLRLSGVKKSLLA